MKISLEVKKLVMGGLSPQEYSDLMLETQAHPNYAKWAECTKFCSEPVSEAEAPYIVLRSQDRKWVRCMRRIFSDSKVLKNLKEWHDLDPVVTDNLPGSPIHQIGVALWESVQMNRLTAPFQFKLAA